MLALAAMSATAQTTAMDFNRMDCNGNMHHLYADLDAGNAVILEFFMLNCTPCITAGHQLESMKTDLLAQYPGKVKSYAIGFTNAYTCTNIANWVTNNSFSSVPMDSGTTPVAYYGGFGMPTVVILGGGTAHSILGTPYIGFSASDTTTMAADIRSSLSTPTGIMVTKPIGDLELFPQPAGDRVHLAMDLAISGELQIAIQDLSGRQVRSILNASQNAGPFGMEIETQSLAPGMYLLDIQSVDRHLTQRLVVAH